MNRTCMLPPLLSASGLPGSFQTYQWYTAKDVDTFYEFIPEFWIWIWIFFWEVEKHQKSFENYITLQ